MDTSEDFSALLAVLHEFGINKGDVLYVASDITRLMYHVSMKYGINSKSEYNEYLDSFVNLLQQTVGKEGTLLFPVYSWDFCRGKLFDIMKTKGAVGALNNWVLQHRKDFKRTQHPIYSFMVWGHDAEAILEMKNIEAWGEDSPFAYFRKCNAKTLMLDVPPARSFTFMHYVESYLRVPWRYMKDFIGIYIDRFGHMSERKYSMYVRDLSIESEGIQDIHILEKAGILKKRSWLEVDLWYMSCRDAFPFYMDDLRNHNAKMCYRFNGYVPDWSKQQTYFDEARD